MWEHLIEELLSAWVYLSSESEDKREELEEKDKKEKIKNKEGK